MSQDLPQGQTISQSQDDSAAPASASDMSDTQPPQPVGTPRKEQGPPLVQAEPVSTPPAVEVPPQAEQEAAPEQSVEHRETASQEAAQKEVIKTQEPVPVVAPQAPVAQITDGLTLPLTYQEALDIEKSTAMDDSKRWFAKLMEFLWKRKDPGIATKKPN